MMQCASAINMVIQDLVPEDKRARVLSYYTMAFFGAAPFGSLLAGMLAHHIGAPHAVIVTGACCIAGSVWFAFELPAHHPAHGPGAPTRRAAARGRGTGRRGPGSGQLRQEDLMHWYSYLAAFFAGAFLANACRTSFTA